MEKRQRFTAEFRVTANSSQRTRRSPRRSGPLSISRMLLKLLFIAEAYQCARNPRTAPQRSEMTHCFRWGNQERWGLGVRFRR